MKLTTTLLLSIIAGMINIGLLKGQEPIELYGIYPGFHRILINCLTAIYLLSQPIIKAFCQNF